MRCPLQLTLAWSTGGVLSTPSRDCLEGECAWWNHNSGECAILSLAMDVDRIEVKLGGVTHDNR